ncbi:STY0301 family protein [Duganella callida]|uniref:DUF3757 domain-containing protein n=1 Tax=Duganella callida TaxID=2561932 RepID=A0A4Y9SK14_9BURK|nr:STY0301 family protein [Duganella callida]TFW21532.1 hypothetical protein E4L98_13195 [Duganella callida]
MKHTLTLGLSTPPLRVNWSAAAVLVLYTTCSTAAPLLECPASIPENSVKLIETPKGWTSFVGSPLYLHGAAPMNGPPEHLGELADYKETGKKPNLTYIYQLDGKFSEGKWLACTYGESDQITLAKRIADDVKVCTFKYKKGRHAGENEIGILCE